MVVVMPVVQTEGCCGLGAVAAGVPNVSPGNTPPMSTWLLVKFTSL